MKFLFGEALLRLFPPGKYPHILLIRKLFEEPLLQAPVLFFQESPHISLFCGAMTYCNAHRSDLRSEIPEVYPAYQSLERRASIKVVLKLIHT